MLLTRGADSCSEDDYKRDPSFLAQQVGATECEQILAMHSRERADTLAQQAFEVGRHVLVVPWLVMVYGICTSEGEARGSTFTPEDVQIPDTMTSHGTDDLYLDHVQIRNSNARWQLMRTH